MSQKKTRKEHEQEINFRLVRFTDTIRCEEAMNNLRRRLGLVTP
jgi:hypothetical protein